MIKSAIKCAILVCFSNLVETHVVQAYWFGNPAAPIEKSQRAIDVTFDFSEREMVRHGGSGGTRTLSARRLYLQTNHALGRSFEIYGRILPLTGRPSLQDIQFDPPIFGGGIGFRYSPLQTIGKVRLGISTSWDWNYGTELKSYSDNEEQWFSDEVVTITRRRWFRINWVELNLAIGASVPIDEKANLYGGVSLIHTDVYLYASGNATNWVPTQRWGSFLGLRLQPHRSWGVAIEAHKGNEQLLGAQVQYSWAESANP